MMNAETISMSLAIILGTSIQFAAGYWRPRNRESIIGGQEPAAKRSLAEILCPTMLSDQRHELARAVILCLVTSRTSDYSNQPL